MKVSITIRDVPDDVLDELTARAARAGESLQAYLRARLIESAGCAGSDSAWNRVRHRIAVTRSALPADAILELRGTDWE
jgi:hypothetical protein